MNEYTCIRCGNKFESKKNAKYCKTCRALAYRENKTQYMRDYRKTIYDVETEARHEQRQKEIEDRQKENAKIMAKEQAKLLKKAAAGDPYARMELARRSKDDLEYWKAYRDACIEYDKQMSKRLGEQVVNGISVYDPDFPERVIENIKLQKKIISKFIYS